MSITRPGQPRIDVTGSGVGAIELTFPDGYVLTFCPPVTGAPPHARALVDVRCPHSRTNVTLCLDEHETRVLRAILGVGLGVLD